MYAIKKIYFNLLKKFQGVTVETAYRLDDDTWHTVLVEKNRKEAMVVVDGARKGQVNEPRGPVRPMILDGGLFVGATRDAADGFVGCMRALMLNGVIGKFEAQKVYILGLVLLISWLFF